MFNGYNETPLISYEFSQERVEKKQENVPKWAYGQGTGVQPTQSHPNSRHSEFWSGKSCFLGISNVKCNCTSCYPSSENQSYQGDTARHRPWLPRTFPVPLNGSNESCKLPAYQWDNGCSNQGSCYPERNFPFTQESDGKYPYYNQYETSRLPEPNQPGVITSVKDVEYAKKPKNDIYPLSQESSIQNGTKQPVFCNPAYNLTKRVDGRNYCNPNEKYSNVASYSIDQHISRLPVVEPFIKAVPSNLSQNRVPSTGYRSVKETVPQSYVDSGYCSERKICTELVNSGEKKSEGFSTGQIQSSIHLDYSQFNRELSEIEPQKLFFDSTRHPDYYSRNNFQDFIKRNGQILDNRKECAINQISPSSTSDQIYGMYRSKYQEIGNSKPPCDTFYPKDVEKARPGHQVLESEACFERNKDKKNENTNAHSRLPRSALLFNDPRFDEGSLNSFPYQNNPASCRNYLRPELSYQGFNLQPGFEYPAGLQRNDVNQYRVTLQQMQSCEQFTQQENSTFVYDPHCQRNSDKTQQICGGKNPSPVQTNSQPFENRKTNYLEAIRSEEINKNGATKISPLRLLRKKKFINVPQESAPVSTLDAAPGLDVRKFWSTWAEEEEENVAPTQMVVLDCQNIDPEQAKLLHLCETDPIRAVHLESGSIFIKNSGCLKESTNQTVHFEEIKTCEQKPANEPETDKQANAKIENEANDIQLLREETEKVAENNLEILSEPEYKSPPLEPFGQMTSPSKPFRRAKSAHEDRGKKKTETMDKWTEKKFDFLKKAEESKAAEILRHEEEKKKILQTRLSLQQSSKKTDKPKEKSCTEKTEGASENSSPFDEDSRNDSPQSEGTVVSSLPTSEYRRNKFLDYSDRKIIVNGKNKFERGTVEKGSICTNPFMADEATELDEMKKEENVKLECSDKWPVKHLTEKVFPSLNVKLKDEAIFEMDDILKRISEINFQNPEVKLENGLEDVKAKKLRPSAKKTKKKKSEHQPENGERTDKVTVETVTKPTIKFSIQKSHDLKISFKVLNSSKEYSDEERRGEDAEAKGNAIEDSKNSTELITLKYKSIQRDGDKTQISNLKKGRRGFRRKKGTPDMKTPVLKIKKSRYLPQGKRDPLSCDDADLNVSKKPCADESSASDNFQVQETVDSAKIKLTFKRHKGNFETEYKINSSNPDKFSEFDPVPEECDKHVDMTTSRSRKKSRRTKRHEVFADAGVEYFQDHQASDVENDSESRKSQLGTSLEEGSRNSSVSRDSFSEEENYELEPEAPTFSEYSSDLELLTPKNESQDYSKLMVPQEFEDFAVEVSKLNKETDKCSEKVELKNHLINCLEDDELGKKDAVSLSNFNGFLDVNEKKIKPGEVRLAGKCEEKKADSEKVEIQEISLDFDRNTKSPEMEISHKSGETEETEKLNDEYNSDTVKEKIFFEENISEIKHSKYLEESLELKSEKNNDDEKICETDNSKITQNLGTWKKNLVGSNDVDGVDDDCFDNERVQFGKPEETLATTTPLPAFALCPIAEEVGSAVNEEKISKVRLSCEKITEPCPTEGMSDVKENCVNKISPEFIDSSAFDLEINGACSENSNKYIARYESESDFSACEKKSSSEMSVKSIKNSRDDFEDPRNVETKILNEFADEHQKIPNLARLTSEGPKRSGLDPSEKLMVNSSGNILGCSKMSPEVIESVLEKNSDDGVEYEVCCSRFESTTFDQLIKSDVEKVPENRAVKCAQGFSLAKSPDLALEEGEFPSINLENQSPSLNSEASCSQKQDNLEPSSDDLSLSWKAWSSEIASEELNNLSVDVESSSFKDDNSSKQNDDGNVKEINSPNCETEYNENLQFSPKTNVLEQVQEQFLTDDLACAEDSSTVVKATRSTGTHEVWIDSKHRIITQDVETDLPSQSSIELEDGEIVDSSDEAEKTSLCKEQSSDGVIPASEKLANLSEFHGKNGHFIYRKIERRHSEVSNEKKESKNSELETWSKRKFSKAKSCPPELKYLGVLHKKITALHIPVEDIPLPLGPPPYESCLSFKKYNSLSGAQTESCCTEAKEKPKESISCDRLQKNIQKEIFQPNSPFGVNDLQNCRNPSPPQYVGDDSLDILHRSSKIKFSFTKRSRFSKFLAKNSQLEVPSQAFNTGPKTWEESENSDSKINKKIGTPDCVTADQNSTPKECQIEEVPNANVANEREEPKNCSGLEEIKNSKTCSEQPVELCENLDESIEVIDAMSDFIRDEFYECEDIPTSEDLTYADDLESEKVNDDKFRNIMQNCLDNAKKFLTVGNLKLFSCSVDDLLELDCQASESTLGENETEKPTNHISRDVLLTSCEDTNDDLGLSENVHPTDISMDFVPSFGSDACPEILPVDNWPYLEEEVPSSPVKFKQDDTNLIPTLENALSGNSSEIQIKFCPKNKTERLGCKRGVSETGPKGFRRRSIICDGEALGTCSKIDAQRRKTVDSFTAVSYERDVHDIKSELLRLKSGSEEIEKSLKCRLSLEKLASHKGISFEFKKEDVKMFLENSAKPQNGMKKKSAESLDYESPLWQPKVVLFRISKVELKKILRSSKTHRLLESKISQDSPKREINPETENEIPHSLKKLKSDSEFEKLTARSEHKDERIGEMLNAGNLKTTKLISLPRLDSIKGSFTTVSSTNPDVRNRKKSRFRNLHTKTKPTSKDVNSTAQKPGPSEPILVEGEPALKAGFKDGERVSTFHSQSTKQVSGFKNDSVKQKKKLSEIEPSAFENHLPPNPKSERKLEKELANSQKKIKEDSRQDKHREICEKKHDYRYGRKEKKEDREQRKSKDKHRESQKRRHSSSRASSYDRSRHPEKKSPNGNKHIKSDPDRKNEKRYRQDTSKGDEDWKSPQEAAPEGPWICEVCGFDDADERILHIKNHPFHCQSCHLAFKTETHFIDHLTKRHKHIRNQHHCLLCELSFDTEEQYQSHLETREHRHLESVEKNTINTLFTLLTGAPCPVLGVVEMKPEWLPNQAGTVHFYHQATPLSLALQYLKMHDLSSFSTASSAHST